MTVRDGRADIRSVVTEKQLQDAVIQCARTLGWRVYHTHDSRHSAKGFPDLCMTRRGRLVFAELKGERGRTSPEQDAWLLDLFVVMRESSTVEAYLWRPLHWQSGEIERVLR